jgi:RNA polymerase sigma-70 factor (ECF subfamily)
MSTAPTFDVTRPLAEDFERLFREHYGLIYRTARRVTGSPDDAEDVLQTIFLRLLRRETPPDLQRNPKAYLYRAAVNLSLDVVRLRQRHVLTPDLERLNVGHVVQSSAPDEQMNELTNERLMAAVAELGPKSAEILILRYVHNYSDRQIAQLLGTTRGTIAVSLFRSRARLKKLICAALGGSHEAR